MLKSPSLGSGNALVSDLESQGPCLHSRFWLRTLIDLGPGPSAASPGPWTHSDRDMGLSTILAAFAPTEILYLLEQLLLYCPSQSDLLKLDPSHK